MLLNFTNDNINECIRKESVFIVNATSFVAKNKEMLEMCIEKFSNEKKKQAISLMNILNYNLESLQNLQISLERLKDINHPNFKFRLNEYNTSYTATFHQLFNTTSNIATITKDLLKSPILVNTPSQNKNEMEEKKKTEIQDNDELLISERDEMVYLPYKKKDIENIISEGTYTSPKEVISNFYEIPLSKYSNSASARFREGFNLMRKKEGASFFKSLDLGLELLSKYDLNPAVISACKGIDELDIYLDCLSSNELEKFNIFDIKYEINPTIVKPKNEFA